MKFGFSINIRKKKNKKNIIDNSNNLYIINNTEPNNIEPNNIESNNTSSSSISTSNEDIYNLDVGDVGDVGDVVYSCYNNDCSFCDGNGDDICSMCYNPKTSKSLTRQNDYDISNNHNETYQQNTNFINNTKKSNIKIIDNSKDTKVDKKILFIFNNCNYNCIGKLKFKFSFKCIKLIIIKFKNNVKTFFYKIAINTRKCIFKNKKKCIKSCDTIHKTFTDNFITKHFKQTVLWNKLHKERNCENDIIQPPCALEKPLPLPVRFESEEIIETEEIIENLKCCCGSDYDCKCKCFTQNEIPFNIKNVYTCGFDDMFNDVTEDAIF